MEGEAVAGRKRTRDASSSTAELEYAGDSSPEAKRLHEELLFEILDDDTAADDVGAGGDLASFMKSFEDEISFSASPRPPPSAQDSPSAGEGAQTYSLAPPPPQHSDLGFLLEASDDELGLPPSTSAPSSSPEDKVAGVGNGEAGFGHIWGVEEDNGFGFDSEFSIRSEFTEGDAGVVFDGELFDYADVLSGPSDLSWRSETLPAV